MEKCFLCGSDEHLEWMNWDQDGKEMLELLCFNCATDIYVAALVSEAVTPVPVWLKEALKKKKEREKSIGN